MNKVIDKGFRSCRFVSTFVKHPICNRKLVGKYRGSIFVKSACT